MHENLMEDDNKSYTDCIFTIRKEAIDVGDIFKGCFGLYRIALASHGQRNLDLQRGFFMLPKELWDSFT